MWCTFADQKRSLDCRTDGHSTTLQWPSSLMRKIHPVFPSISARCLITIFPDFSYQTRCLVYKVITIMCGKKKIAKEEPEIPASSIFPRDPHKAWLNSVCNNSTFVETTNKMLPNHQEKNKTKRKQKHMSGGTIHFSLKQGRIKTPFIPPTFSSPFCKQFFCKEN